MRFGKRLALAMIRDAGEAPYVSQKELKHVLVGLEKLCKVYNEQVVIISECSMTNGELIVHINTERAKYGLAQRPFVLDICEVIAHDAEFIRILDSDVVAMRQYVEKCEASVMEAINEWLEAAATAGLISRRDRVENDSVLQGVRTPTKDQPESHQDDLLAELESIATESARIKQYIEVNSAAIRKLLSRRRKGVPECFWSVDEYTNMAHLSSPETGEIVEMVDRIKVTFAKDAVTDSVSLLKVF